MMPNMAEGWKATIGEKKEEPNCMIGGVCKSDVLGQDQVEALLLWSPHI